MNEQEPTIDTETVFDCIERLADESDDGVAEWNEIVETLDPNDEHMEEVEVAVNTLMDRGRIFEPVLGKLRPT